MFSCEFCDIFKDTFFYRTPLVATSAAAAVAVANGRGYFQKYDDADLEIYEYLCPPMKTICRRFPIMEAATGSVL